MELSREQRDAVDAIARWMKTDQQVFRLFGYAGTGKAEALSTSLQTPFGPKLMRDIQIGDQIFGASGQPVTVTGVFPQGKLQSYRVTFRDGVSIDCSEDHLWAVWTTKLRQNKKSPKILTTREIINIGVKFNSGAYRFFIPLCNPVHYTEKELPIPPYTLGAFLGDGTDLGRTPSLIISDDEIISRVAKELSEYVITKTKRISCVCYRLTYPKEYHKNPLAHSFQSLRLNVLAKDKFIPTQYLQGSVKQRWDLLRGLMDTDGSCKNNRTSFSTKSEKLANNICTLVQSLGGTAIKHVYDRKEKSIEYSINIKTFETPFFINSKARNWKLSWKNPPSRAIISIVPTEIKEHQCISVSAEDGLYLTNHFVVTHNTTLAKHVAEGSTLFCAFTGKAAYVLRQKGCEAYTIHQLIYCPKERSRRKLQELELELANTSDADQIEKLEKQIEFEKKKLNSPSFVLNPDSAVSTADLVIVDECSMVNEQMAMDLMSYGTKILVLGDPAQLPPVMGTGFFIKAQPDFMLREIHRQAKGNPIIDLATRVRQREHLSPDGGMVIPWGSVSPDDVLQYDQILVGRNKTRKATNHKIRGLLKRYSTIPVPGDRLVCLRNDHEVGLLNGGIWEVESCYDTGDEFLDLIVKDPETDAGFLAVEAHRHYFMDQEDQPMPWWIRKEAQEFDYGYALTVHKSQGSQWDKVLIFDESGAFGKDAHKHLYTAITRAAKEVKVVVR